MDIVEAVKAEQQRQGLNDKQFARFLEIDKSIWSRIKNQKREPSTTFLSAVLRHLPALKQAVVEYMEEVKK